MAKGKKTGGKDWEAGFCPNKDGRPKIPEDIKAARSLTRFEFERIANKYLFLKRGDLELALLDPETTSIESMVISIITKAVSFGDDKRLSFLLDRLIGTVKDPLDITSVDNPLNKIIQGAPTDKLLRLLNAKPDSN